MLQLAQLSLYADLQYRNILHSIDGIDDDLRDLTKTTILRLFKPKTGNHFSSNIKLEGIPFLGRKPRAKQKQFTDADQMANSQHLKR